jgi:hypothetical protein
MRDSFMSVKDYSMLGEQKCKICDSIALFAGSRLGRYRQDTTFHYYSCQNCYFSFVGNPWLEFDKIYCIDYYKGKGADPLVDYFSELKYPKCIIRKYEWAGIAKIVKHLVSDIKEPQYLDYGCGSGGLIRYLSNNFNIKGFGFEQGNITSYLNDISLLNEKDLHEYRNRFDIITAIEVIEHSPDPLFLLKEIRSLLKPNGFFFIPPEMLILGGEG